MSPIKSVRVVCAIIEHDGKFLAAKRSASQSHGGFWEFPGGKIDPGENAELAIFREIKEELATEISITKKLPSVTFNYPDKTVTLIPFIGETAAGGFITPLEHEEVRWVDKNESQELAWLPPDAEILNNYRKHKP
jgi:8-oxo-dGTP diphosphatase